MAPNGAATVELLKVLLRMTSERQLLINRSQFEGEAEALKIRSEADRKAAELLSGADAKAREIRGQGEAEAAKSLSVFQQNPELANFIFRLEALEEPDERPVWVTVWGGPISLAQALWKIQHTRAPAQAERLYRKLRVYAISDQDDSGPWIRRTFPQVFYIVSPGDYGRSTWSAITQPDPATRSELISNHWLAENIQQGHGPLGAVYPDVAWGMEGDTPSFLGLIPNGLNAPEHPNWGGWGGRYELSVPRPTPLSNNVAEPGKEKVPVAETRPIWTNAEDAYSPIVPQAYGRAFRLDSAAGASPAGVTQSSSKVYVTASAEEAIRQVTMTRTILFIATPFSTILTSRAQVVLPDGRRRSLRHRCGD